MWATFVRIFPHLFINWFVLCRSILELRYPHSELRVLKTEHVYSTIVKYTPIYGIDDAFRIPSFYLIRYVPKYKDTKDFSNKKISSCIFVFDIKKQFYEKKTCMHSTRYLYFKGTYMQNPYQFSVCVYVVYSSKWWKSFTHD